MYRLNRASTDWGIQRGTSTADTHRVIAVLAAEEPAGGSGSEVLGAEEGLQEVR